MIGGSHISNHEQVSLGDRSSPLGRVCKTCGVLFVLVAMLLFGGAAGDWFAVELSSGVFWVRCLQLSMGASLMGALVAIPGSLLFGRNPIRWGMGMPLMVYVGGTLMALLTDRSGATALLFSAPLLIGFAIAAGVMGAFCVDGFAPRSSKA